MNLQLVSVLALLGVAITMFAMNRPRMDAVALLMLVALPFTGSVSVGEALSGFSEPNIVLIAALFVLGDGLARTGVARLLGAWLIDRAGRSEARLMALLMLVVAVLGATMSSTAVTAIFIPVVLRIAQNTGTRPGRLMMPLSIAALISGMLTLIATAPNLVVNNQLIQHLQRQGRADAPGFHFFSFTPFGIPILALAIGYMMLARRWLSASDGDQVRPPRRPTLRDWVGQYRLDGKLHRLAVTSRSSLAGKTLAELKLRTTAGVTVLAVERGPSLLQALPHTRILAGDILFVAQLSPEQDPAALRSLDALDLLPIPEDYFTAHSQDLGMVEVILPATSELVEKSVVESGLRSRHGLMMLAARRGPDHVVRDPRNEKLRVGDSLLLAGPWKSIRRLGSGNRDLVILDIPAEMEHVVPVPGKALHAVVVLLIVIGLMISGIIPNVQAALIGCLLLGALGIVSMQSAYQAIDWKTIVLIAGMLPFSLALQRTGLVDLLAGGVTRVSGGAGQYLILAVIFALTAACSLFMSNTATAVLMAPVALAVADQIGASPYPFAMIVALAASTAFVTPVSSPVNALVVTPGNYRFGDFVRVGLPLSILVMVFSVFAVAWWMPLYPR
jgi:di/tricarboxylate transporter